MFTRAASRTESYSYDDAGNLLTFSNGSISHSYTYGDSQWGDLLTAVDGQPIQYDAIGNPTSYYDGYRYTFTWEQGRQLKSSTYNNRTTNYRYNEDGLRTEKYWADGSSVKYDIVDGKTVGEIRYGANGILSLYMRYIFDEAGSVTGIGIWTAGSGHWTDYYFVKNLQGDVIEVYDTNNTLAASYTYDAWGNILTKSGDLAELNPFRYRTYYFDNETWFYYASSRYYDPAIGRWINADDTAYLGADGTPLSYNLFAYCLNNPTCRKDILGNTSVKIFDSNGNGLSDDEEFAGSGGNGGNNGTNGNQPRNSTSLTSYYPPNNGFKGTPVETTLEPGSLIQRTGPTNGRFVAPAGTPTETLSLPYNQVGQPTTTYIVNQPISVLSGTAMPWFGSMGGGMQYLLLDGTVSTLLCRNMISLFGGIAYD